MASSSSLRNENQRRYEREKRIAENNIKICKSQNAELLRRIKREREQLMVAKDSVLAVALEKAKFAYFQFVIEKTKEWKSELKNESTTTTNQFNATATNDTLVHESSSRNDSTVTSELQNESLFRTQTLRSEESSSSEEETTKESTEACESVLEPSHPVKNENKTDSQEIVVASKVENSEDSCPASPIIQREEIDNSSNNTHSRVVVVAPKTENSEDSCPASPIIQPEEIDNSSNNTHSRVVVVAPKTENSEDSCPASPNIQPEEIDNSSNNTHSRVVVVAPKTENSETFRSPSSEPTTPDINTGDVMSTHSSGDGVQISQSSNSDEEFGISPLSISSDVNDKDTTFSLNGEGLEMTGRENSSTKVDTEMSTKPNNSMMGTMYMSFSDDEEERNSTHRSGQFDKGGFSTAMSITGGGGGVAGSSLGQSMSSPIGGTVSSSSLNLNQTTPMFQAGAISSASPLTGTSNQPMLLGLGLGRSASFVKRK